MSRKIASGFLLIKSACLIFTMYIFQKYMILPSLLRVAIFVLFIILMLIGWLKLYKKKSVIKNLISILISIIVISGLSFMDYHLYTNLTFLDKLYASQDEIDIRSRNINTEKSSFNVFITGINILGYGRYNVDTNVVANVDPINKKIKMKAYPKFIDDSMNQKSLKAIDSLRIQRDIDKIEKEQKIDINYYICFTKKLQLNELLELKTVIDKASNLEKVEAIKNFLKDRVVTNMPTSKIVGIFNANILKILSPWEIESKVIV